MWFGLIKHLNTFKAFYLGYVNFKNTILCQGRPSFHLFLFYSYAFLDIFIATYVKIAPLIVL